jgi:hypothetical protein
VVLEEDMVESVVEVLERWADLVDLLPWVDPVEERWEDLEQ